MRVEEDIIDTKYKFEKKKQKQSRKLFLKVVHEHSLKHFPFRSYIIDFKSFQSNELPFNISFKVPALMTTFNIIKDSEDNEHKFYGIMELEPITSSNIKDIQPFIKFVKIAKSMLKRKLLSTIDKDFQKYTHWACQYN